MICNTVICVIWPSSLARLARSQANRQAKSQCIWVAIDAACLGRLHCCALSYAAGRLFVFPFWSGKDMVKSKLHGQYLDTHKAAVKMAITNHAVQVCCARLGWRTGMLCFIVRLVWEARYAS